MDLTRAEWRKPSRSGDNGGNCVEVARNLPRVVAVRDSKNPHGPVLTVEPAGWRAFIADVKAGLARPDSARVTARQSLIASPPIRPRRIRGVAKRPRPWLRRQPPIIRTRLLPVPAISSSRPSPPPAWSYPGIGSALGPGPAACVV